MRRFSVSRSTIRRALTALAEDGLISRRPRYGTFVVARDDTARRPRVITNTVMGYEAEILDVRYDELCAPCYAADFLELSADDRAGRFVRVEAIDGMPLSMVVNYLPLEIARRISVPDLEQHSMLETLERFLEIRLGAMHQQVEARLPDDEVATRLGVDLTEPVLCSRLFVSDVDRRPIQVVDTSYRSDRTSYTVDFLYRPRFAGGKWRHACSTAKRSGALSIPHLEVRSPRPW